MNKTLQLLQDRSDLFDKEFNPSKLVFPEIDVKKLKSFNDQTISLLLNSLKEEIKEKTQEVWGLGGGHNMVVKLNDISTLLSETISNLTKSNE